MTHNFQNLDSSPLLKKKKPHATRSITKKKKMSELTPQQKYDLISQNLQEVLNKDIIMNVLENENRPLKIYWGTAPTGRPHCGYFVPMTKIAHFLSAGCEVTVLLADLHAFLDNMKAPLEVVGHRVKYYKIMVEAILTGMGAPVDKLKFVIGKEYQLSQDYTLDIFKLANVVSVNGAKRAGADVVKQLDNPLLSGLIYPLMQALDEQYLDVDAQFGGIDQRKIFVLAEENLPSLNYKKRGHLMNPMVPGLGEGGKMSASDPNSKIDLLETADMVKKKIKKAYAKEGEHENNGLIAMIEFVFLPISAVTGDKPTFYVNRDEKWGGPITYHDIETIRSDYAANKLTPPDLKIGVTDALNKLLEPIRQACDSDEFRELEKLAYPPPVAEPKKEKKKKNRGTRFPGSAAQDANTEAAAAAAATAAAKQPSVDDLTKETKQLEVDDEKLADKQ